ncbi:hypothetical protein BU17DRAFT_69221 [Hysterangium stoloniferum]|nr:hypothetical protein BU17DRAFT_69221 [Hysterangium stoloniferum]
MSYGSVQIASFVQEESDLKSGIFSQENYGGVTCLYVAARVSMLLYQTPYPIWAFTGPYETNYNGNIVMNRIRNVTGSGLCYHSFTAVSALILARYEPQFLQILELMFLQITVLLENCNTSFPEQMTNISNGIALLYDAAIFGVTVYHTWTLVSFALCAKVRPPATPLRLNNVQDNPVMDTSNHYNRQFILVLRFFLDLREQNVHPYGTSQTRDEAPCSSLKAAARKFSNAIIEDIGDPEDEQFFGSQATRFGTVSGRVLRPAASDAENNDSSPAVNLEVFS